jgi:hypothetical protein
MADLPTKGETTTDTWVGGVSGHSWSNGVPTATSDVVIPNDGRVNITGDYGSIHSLTLTPATNPYTVASGVSITGALDVLSAAGFGSAGVLTGSVTIGQGSLEFAQGQINTIAEYAFFVFGGADALLCDAAHPDSDSALNLNTIAGAFYLENDADLNNSGTLLVTASGEFDIFPGSFDQTTNIDGTLTNDGLIQEEEGVTDYGGPVNILIKTKGLINNGTISLDFTSPDDVSGSISGDIKLGGPVTNNGKIKIVQDTQNFWWWVGGSGSIGMVSHDIGGIKQPVDVGFFGGVSGGQNIYFNSYDAMLTLRDTSDFYGKIGGFGWGDTILSEDFGVGTTANFVEASNNKGGTLTLTNGDEVAHLQFWGSYSNSDFAVTSTAGGTTIKFV